ncbi:MAG: CHAT domain-containing protein [Phaeodactylibacter sp.]|nr:CHAT domain-containing protein [Phaeodactylibacter sp.]
MNKTIIFLALFSLSVPLESFCQTTPISDSLLISLLDYKKEALDAKVDERYQSLDLSDSLALKAIIDSLVYGRQYQGISLDKIIQGFDWNEALKKADWNCLFRDFDWNQAMGAVCNGEQPGQVELPGLGQLTDSAMANTPMAEVAKCLQPDMRQMMAAVDQDCFVQKMMAGKIKLSPDPGDIEAFCAIAECVDFNACFKEVDWNCLMESVDFNALLKNWKMDRWLESMKTVRLSNGRDTIIRQMGRDPVMSQVHPDTLQRCLMAAFEGFFDASHQVAINRNFYERVFGDHWLADHPGHLRGLLQLVSPFLVNEYGETRAVKYFLAYLWSYVDMQEDIRQLDFAQAHARQILIKDIWVTALLEGLFDGFLGGDEKIRNILNTQAQIDQLAAVHQLLGHTLSKLGRHAEALEKLQIAAGLRDFLVRSLPPAGEPDTFLEMSFSDTERSRLMKEYGISSDLLDLEKDALFESRHPKRIELFLEQRKHEDALACYLLFKDLLLLQGLNNKVNPSFEIPNEPADKGFELELLKSIYGNMAAILPEADSATAARYATYSQAKAALEKFQLNQKRLLLYNEIGGVYYEMKNYDLALDSMQAAWNMLKQLKNLDYIITSRPGVGTIETDYFRKMPVYVMIINNVAQVHLSRKSYGQAVEFLQDAIGYLEEVAEKDSTIKAENFDLKNDLFEVYGTLGWAFLLKKDTAEALRHFNTCRQIAGRSGIAFHPFYASLYLGSYYEQTHAPDSALIHFQHAVRLAQAMRFEHGLSTAYGKTGFVYQQQGLPEKALMYYDSSQAIARSLGQYDILYNLEAFRGKLFAGQGRYPKALSFYESGIRIIEDSIFANVRGEGSRQLALESGFACYAGAISCALQLNDQEKAFQYLQQSKARIFNELLAEGALALDNVPKDLLDRKRALQAQLNEYQKRLVDANPAATRSRQDSLLSELGIVKAKIRDASPEYAALAKPALATLEEVQGLLGSNQAFIEYFVEDNILAFVITKEKAAYVSLGQSREILADVFNLNDTLQSVTERELSSIVMRNKRFEAISNLAEKLYQSLMAPVAEGQMLQGVDELIIAPDHALNFLPFEMLIRKGEEGGNRYLIDDFDVSYCQSATTLIQTENPAKTRRDYSRDLLVAAKSEFDSNPDLRNLKPIDKAAFAGYFASTDFLLEESATADTLAAMNLEVYKYIYVSTHGKIDPIPELSYLELSGGRMSLYNTFDLNLKSKAMILSACQTGQGEFRRGGGVMGFARGLMVAGTQAVALSLWPVEDEASERLFAAFFRRLSTGDNPRKALNEAKRDLKDSGNLYAHPFYWAPFVFIGAR